MKINKFFIAFLIFFFILFFAILRYFSSRNSYDIRIQIGLDNLSISNIERNLVVDLKKELLKVKEVKEVVILTKRNSCNVYLRLKPFIVKNEAFLKIQTKIAFFEAVKACARAQDPQK